MLVNGRMIKGMEKASILLIKNKLKKVYGSRIIGLNG